MNSLRNFSKKDLKLNKRKNILVIIAIILSTCLITSISTMVYSIHKMYVKRIEKQTGTAHVCYKYLTDKQLQILKNHKQISEIGEFIPIGHYKNKKFAPYSLVFAYEDETTAKLQNITLKEGTWPKKENEIVVQKWMLTKMGFKPTIGEKIDAECTNCFVWQEKPFKIKSTFVVCGILEDTSNDKINNSAIGIISKEYISKNMKPEDICVQAFARIKGNNISKTANEIGKNIGIEDKKHINLNERYINAMHPDDDLIMVSSVIAIVVVAATVFVIYNIFLIHIREKVKQIGMLAALGATKKQIRKIIFREGFILSIFGIPLGVILGTALSFAVGPLVILAHTSVEIETDPYIILTAIFISLITIMLSLIKPSRVAAKIPPIEAVRYTGVQLNEKKKERKSKGAVSLNRLAYLNLWRNKKRTILTMLSISLTGVLIIAFSSIFDVVNVDTLVNNQVNGDIELSTTNEYTGDDSEANPLNEQLVNKLRAISGVKAVSTFKYSNPLFNDGNPCNFYGYDKELLGKSKNYITSGKISTEELQNGNNVIMLKRDEWKNYRYAKYKVGDKVKISHYKDAEKKEMVEKELTISAIVDEKIAGLDFSFTGPFFIVHEANFGKLVGENRVAKVIIDVKKENYNEVENVIKNISEKDKDIVFKSKKQYKEDILKEIMGQKLAGYSLVFIIGLLGAVNLINTMITSIMARKKELGMMQAVGLSNIQLRKLLQIEGMYYSIVGIITSITLGTALGYMFYLTQKTGNRHIQYKFPIVSVLIVIIGFLVIQASITYMVEKNLNKESVIDRIRYNE